MAARSLGVVENRAYPGCFMVTKYTRRCSYLSQPPEATCSGARLRLRSTPASPLRADAEGAEAHRLRVGDHAQALRSELAEGGETLVVARAVRPVPGPSQEPLVMRALPQERVPGDLDRAAPARDPGTRRTELGQDGILVAIEAVQGGRQRLAPHQPPARGAGLGRGERLRIDGPLVPQHVPDA